MVLFLAAASPAFCLRPCSPHGSPCTACTLHFRYSQRDIALCRVSAVRDPLKSVAGSRSAAQGRGGTPQARRARKAGGLRVRGAARVLGGRLRSDPVRSGRARARIVKTLGEGLGGDGRVRARARRLAAGPSYLHEHVDQGVEDRGRRLLVERAAPDARLAGGGVEGVGVR